MKELKIPDELYDKILKISDNIRKSDNRATAEPFIYRISDEINVWCNEWSEDWFELIHDCESFYIFDYNSWKDDSDEFKELLNECINSFWEDIIEEINKYNENILDKKQ